MIKLIVGVKGTGKTKTLIGLVNAAAAESTGAVICIECGSKLNFDITHKARLVDTKSFNIEGGEALYGFIAGMLASNHDITDVYVDSALKICKNDIDEFEKFVISVNELVEGANIKCEMTVSCPAENLSEKVKKFIELH